jgi:prepilin-type N-terminal cleavage/methylation domain-containing protein
MENQSRFNAKGITLIELLIALVIFGMVVAGIYRLFIAQSKAYTVQDQIVDVQQNIRSAMEILLKDLRMAGCDDDNINSTVIIITPIVYPLKDDSITVNYEYYDKADLISPYKKYAVSYWRDAANSRLIRQLDINDAAGSQEILLENVDAFNSIYGVDTNEDGAVDNWVSAATVGLSKVIALRVSLTAKPTQVNPDLQMVSPRTLASTITLRNQCWTR